MISGEKRSWRKCGNGKESMFLLTIFFVCVDNFYEKVCLTVLSIYNLENKLF